MKKNLYLFMVLLCGYLLSACNNKTEEELDFKDYPIVVDTILDNRFFNFENYIVYEGELQIQNSVFKYRCEQNLNDKGNVNVSLDTDADTSLNVYAYLSINDNELTIKDFPCNMTVSLIKDSNVLLLMVFFTNENGDTDVAGIKTMVFINN